METWIQTRQTKLGLATIKIAQVQDLFEATVSLYVDGIEGAYFGVTETFGDARCAFLWAYGLKQSINDDFAGYIRVGMELKESKPKKGQSPIIISLNSALNSVSEDYHNFRLGRTSSSKGDTISTAQVKASTLSPEDQTTLLELMARAKAKVINA